MNKEGASDTADGTSYEDYLQDKKLFQIKTTQMLNVMEKQRLMILELQRDLEEVSAEKHLYKRKYNDLVKATASNTETAPLKQVTSSSSASKSQSNASKQFTSVDYGRSRSNLSDGRTNSAQVGPDDLPSRSPSRKGSEICPEKSPSRKTSDESEKYVSLPPTRQSSSPLSHHRQSSDRNPTVLLNDSRRPSLAPHSEHNSYTAEEKAMERERSTVAALPGKARIQSLALNPMPHSRKASFGTSVSSESSRLSDTSIDGSQYSTLSPTVISNVMPLVLPNELIDLDVHVFNSFIAEKKNKKGKECIMELVICGRDNGRIRWKVHKTYTHFHTLESQISSSLKERYRIAAPEKSLFMSTSKSKEDKRTLAVNAFLGKLLSIDLDERSSMAFCSFLSCDVKTETEHERLKSNVIKEGYIACKREGSWTTYYAQLRQNILEFAHTPRGDTVFALDLKTAKVTDLIDAPNDRSYQFRASLDEKKIFKFSIETGEDKGEWLNAISQFTTIKQERRESQSRSHLTDLLKKSDYSQNIGTLPSEPAPMLKSPRADEMRTKNGDLAPPGVEILSKSFDKAKPTKKKSFWFSRSNNSSVDLSHGVETSPHHRSITPSSFNAEQPGLFGCSLEEAYLKMPPKNCNMRVPAVFLRCLEYLDVHEDYLAEGIMRLSGSSNTIRLLQERFEKHLDIDITAEKGNYDLHAVAGLLKLYLRTLPESVLTKEKHQSYIQTSDIPESKKRIAAYRALLIELPLINYTVLYLLMAHLVRIAKHSDKNKMTERNLSIVFSPTFNVPASTFCDMIVYFDNIFEKNPRQMLSH